MKINQGCWRSTGKKKHNKHSHSIDPGPVSGWMDKKLIIEDHAALLASLMSNRCRFLCKSKDSLNFQSEKT